MKKIFIYYSLSGNGDMVANYLKDKRYEIRKVDTREQLPKNMILRIIIGGYKAMINHKDKLLDFDNNIEDYNEVVIGSPIWNSKLSSPINSVLDNISLEGKRLTFILYSGSGKDSKAMGLIKVKYPDSNIINIQEPKKNTKELEKIKVI